MGLYQPFAAAPYFTNAFALGYTGLNTVTFYVTLPVQVIIGVPLTYLAKSKLGLDVSVSSRPLESIGKSKHVCTTYIFFDKSNVSNLES